MSNPESQIKIDYGSSFSSILHRLRSSKSIDDNFQELICRCIKNCSISVEEISEAFGISQSSVFNWTEGKNLPLPSIRPQVYNWFALRIELYLRGHDVKCLPQDQLIPE